MQVDKDVWERCCFALRTPTTMTTELESATMRLVGSLKTHVLFLIGAIGTPSQLQPLLVSCAPAHHFGTAASVTTLARYYVWLGYQSISIIPDILSRLRPVLYIGSTRLAHGVAFLHKGCMFDLGQDHFAFQIGFVPGAAATPGCQGLLSPLDAFAMLGFVLWASCQGACCCAWLIGVCEVGDVPGSTD